MGRKKNKTQDRLWKGFIARITLVLILFVVCILLGLVWRERDATREQSLDRARSHFNNIVLTRRWNARHGGVYVEKLPGVESNPYLEDPDIVTADGRIFTMKNPALMTREVSELAKKAGYFSYHITSLNPLNPHNGPTEFEEESLKSFEKGVKEVYGTKINADGSVTYRYMAPLNTEESCLKCHKKQGYQGGDIRGGISVYFDVTQVEKAVRGNIYLVAGLIISSALIILLMVYFFIFNLMKELRSAQEKMRSMAVTDELTGLYNRRHFMSLLQRELYRARRYNETFTLIMADIDHFKDINDNYGHPAGDSVLISCASILKSCVRESDTVARYGGEEFMILLPRADLKSGLAVAEKLRKAMEEHPFKIQLGKTIKVTLSAGVVQCPMPFPLEFREHHMIKATDLALYQAKESGRNRVKAGQAVGQESQQ